MTRFEIIDAALDDARDKYVKVKINMREREWIHESATGRLELTMAAANIELAKIEAASWLRIIKQLYKWQRARYLGPIAAQLEECDD